MGPIVFYKPTLALGVEIKQVYILVILISATLNSLSFK